MAINLQKGQRINIGLSKMIVGLGWDPNETTGFDFDLDASAFMIDTNGKIIGEEYFVFYGNLKSPDGALEHTGDDPDGNSSDGDDDEAIIIDLDKVNERVTEIIFVVTIDEANSRKQNFGQVRNSYIRLLDNTSNEEIAKYELDEDFSIETAVDFGRLYKKSGAWKFEASGLGYKEDLSFFLKKYFEGKIIK